MTAAFKSFHESIDNLKINQMCAHALLSAINYFIHKKSETL